MYLSILAIIYAVVRVEASRMANELPDVTYQDNEDFKREIRDKIEELHKNNGKMFDRILMVNDIHKRWKRKDELAKRNVNADNVINNINTADDNPLFEGDIVLDQKEKLQIDKTESYRRKRNAVHSRKRIWTTRQIPFHLDSGLTQEARDAILKAIGIIHANTCVRWVPYNSRAPKHFVWFKKGKGCFSTIGKAYASTEGYQDLSIGKGCEWVAIALHEMTHAMGFFHEQSRNDRNRHIKIIWANIEEGLEDQFMMYSHGTIDKMKKDYDMKSLMHYSATAFGKKGKTTIVPIDASQSIGDAEQYTPLDIVEINALYNCKTQNERISTWSQWSECDKSCNKERQRFCFSENKKDCPSTNTYGVESQVVKCASWECPARIDGNWGIWSSWSECSKKCDEGRRRRTRQCNRPAPGNGGKTCIGASTDTSVCLVRRCFSGKYDADFENGWGVWFSANNKGLIPWAIHSGRTKTMNTGPRGDHTLQGRGNYVYVESSRLEKGDTARLVSRMLEFSTPQCLSFYYNMYGEKTGSLTLWIVPEGQAWAKLFEKTGDQGQDWHNGLATLNKGKFQLIFEVALGGGGYSDTALDDIFITEGACPCVETSTSCPNWAKVGQCGKNPDYMLKYCQISCGVLCSRPQKKITVFVPPTTTAPKIECKDNDARCYGWAIAGECKSNPRYMVGECKASCGLCGDCKDLYKEKVKCGTWAEDGYCSKRDKFMMAYCKKSCTGCPDPCVDDSGECPKWAKTGECEGNASWMGTNCKKSCGKC